MSESIALNRPDGSPVFLDTEGRHHPENGTLLGFWIYLLSDLMIFGSLIVFFLIVEPHGLARLWSIAKEKLRLWPFPH